MTEQEVRPVLTLAPIEELAVPALALDQVSAPKSVALANVEEGLSTEELAQVDEFSKQIDVTNSNQVLMYGASSQKNIAGFAEGALARVRTKDLGEVGNMIGNLVVELKGFTTGDEKGAKGLFKRSQNRIASLKARYDKAEVNVDKIANILENHQVQLLKDVTLLEKMYDLNVVYFKELTMYILAGKKKLEEVRATVLPDLVAKAEASGRPEEAQVANDFSNLCNRFEKKIYDLDLTRTVSMQMGPQIRLVQNNDALMVEKIQSSLVNTIPLWKSQMVLALGLEHSRQAMQAQRAVTDMTNELLKKNAEKLKIGTIETAKEAERGVVDIETLKVTNQMLISTFDEVLKIQDQGRQQRAAAEVELRRIEGELKQKLLEIRK